MRNFVLSRRGWKKSNTSDDLCVFLEKYPITINILYSGSPGILMVKTATEIAKSELINELTENGNLEEAIIKIVKSIESQDWTIPFIRNKV